MNDEVEGKRSQSPHEQFNRHIPSRLSAGSLQQRIIDSDMRSLEETFSRFASTGEVEHAATVILGTRRRFIVGMGISASTANLLSAELALILSNVFTVNDRELSPQNVLTDVRPTDVLVTVQVRRYRKSTVELGRLFHAAGGKLVVITDSDESPLADIASAVVVVKTRSMSYIDSPTSMAATCHLLAALVAASSKGAKRRITTSDQVAHDLGLYVAEETDQQ